MEKENVYIATIATGENAAREVGCLVASVRQWHPTATMWVLTDTATTQHLPEGVKTVIGLDAYAGLTRSDMEAQPGKTYTTKWHDFMIEKATILERVFEAVPDVAQTGVWFLDADVTLFAPLPLASVAHPDIRLGLSPHIIRAADEARFGRFNGGYLWLRDRALLTTWRRATYGSRFYEQAALETVWDACPAMDRVAFPLQDNFGWWRLGQSADPPSVIQSRLGYNRMHPGVGILYDGAPLRSVHTHWAETSEFNTWMRGVLERLARSHPPAKALYNRLTNTFWTTASEKDKAAKQKSQKRR